MKIVVLGAGIVGVSTAYFLARDGHDVVVVDREGEVGQGASGANAGLIAPGHSYAWASPAAPKMVITQGPAGERVASCEVSAAACFGVIHTPWTALA